MYMYMHVYVHCKKGDYNSETKPIIISQLYMCTVKISPNVSEVLQQSL